MGKKIEIANDTDVKNKSVNLNENISVDERCAEFESKHSELEKLLDTGEPDEMIMTLTFMDYTLENLQKIGPKHQVIGLTHKGKFELGNTYINKYTGQVNSTLYYSVKIAKIEI